MKTIDVDSLLDEGRSSSYQKLLVAATALAIIVDGLDTQILANAVPALIREWSLPRGAFVSALALGPLGMMVGGAIGGVLGDRIGRRTALLISVLTFSALTLAIATVNGVATLGLLRFLSGLGLGGAMPNAAALASEFVARRQRPVAVTLTIVCFPLGGTLAALVSAQVLPAYGWRSLFVIGGLFPILLAIILFALLPESPKYLVNRRERWPELVRLLRKLGHDVGGDVQFVEGGARAGSATSRSSVGELFEPVFRIDTLGLCGAFFFGLMTNNMGIQLIPVMLTAAGFTQTVASNALAAWNFGGVAGAILGALIIQRLGSRLTMLGLSALTIATALLMAALPPDPLSTLRLIILFVLLGGALNAVITTMYALAANVYPTHVRGTGIGTAVATGRLGMVLAAYVGNFALDAGGAPAYFTALALAMVVVFGSLAVIGRHIEPTTPALAPAPVARGGEA